MSINTSQKRLKVLVVAPEFPLINQPWMDTYLEQLIINKVDISVFSLNNSPSRYNTKVDTLNLLDYTFAYSFRKSNMLQQIIKKPRIYSTISTFLKLRRQRLLGSVPNIKLLFYIAYFYAVPEVYKGISVIHSHSEALSHRFIILAEMLNTPLVMTFHGLPPKGVPQLSSEKRKELYSYAKTVVVNTNFAKQQVVDFGCPAEKVKILPQGLPIEDFPFNPAPFPANGQPLRILSVGRFHRDKGQHYSLLALKRLLNDGVPVHWTFVGSGPDLEKLKTLANKLHVDKQVTFRVGVSSMELLNLYHESQIFVLASINTPGAHIETQGVVLQEAQASGSIVVATRTGGIPECLNHDEDAVLVAQQSSRGIHEAISAIYHNPDSWSELRKNARENVEKKFGANVIGAEMADMLMSHSCNSIGDLESQYVREY